MVNDERRLQKGNNSNGSASNDRSDSKSFLGPEPSTKIVQSPGEYHAKLPRPQRVPSSVPENNEGHLVIDGASSNNQRTDIPHTVDLALDETKTRKKRKLSSNDNSFLPSAIDRSLDNEDELGSRLDSAPLFKKYKEPSSRIHRESAQASYDLKRSTSPSSPPKTHRFLKKSEKEIASGEKASKNSVPKKSRTAILPMTIEQPNGLSVSRAGRDSIAEACDSRRIASTDSEAWHYGNNLPTTPPPSTPIIVSESPGNFTSPRQRELWNALLPKTHQDFTLSHLHLSSPESRQLNVVVPPGQPMISPRSIAKYRKTQTSNRRKKLVDNLQCIDRTTNNVHAVSKNGPGAADDDVENVSAANSLKIDGSNEDLQSQGTDAVEGQSDRVLSRGEHQAALSSGGLKVTYAYQRSYLTSNDLSESALPEVPLEDSTDAHMTSSQPSGRYLTPRLFDEQGESDEQVIGGISHGGSMRTIHELREAGNSVRQLSDMEAIFDDLDRRHEVPVSLRRGRLMDLTHELQEPSYCRTFIDQGFLPRLLGHTNSSDDAIVDVLLAAIILCLISIPPSGQDISHMSEAQVVQFLTSCLDRDQELLNLARHRGLNMSKVAQSEFRQTCDYLRRSPLWRGQTPLRLTGRLLALQALEYLVRRMREAGCKAEILPQKTLRRIASVLPTDRSNAVSLQRTKDIFYDIFLAVSILESCTISDVSLTEEQWTGEILEQVINLLPNLNDPPGIDISSTHTLALRLYLNLTNNNPRLCKAFARSEVISAIFSIIDSHFKELVDTEMKCRSASLLDNLILSLGSLINLSEWCDDVRALVMTLKLGQSTYLELLLRWFLSGRERAGEVK